MGWNFENWAKENGLTSSGGRFRDCMKPKSENGDCEKLTVASNSADKMREKGNDSLVNAAEGIDTNVMKNGELELVQNKDSEPARKRRSAGQVFFPIFLFFFFFAFCILLRYKHLL